MGKLTYSNKTNVVPIVNRSEQATAGNLDDTLPGNIVISGIYVIGHFWKP